MTIPYTNSLLLIKIMQMQTIATGFYFCLEPEVILSLPVSSTLAVPQESLHQATSIQSLKKFRTSESS